MSNARSKRRLRILALLGLVLLPAAALAACGEKEIREVRLDPLPQVLDAPVYVVVNDTTKHGEGVSAARAAAFAAIVRAAFEHGAGLVLVSAGSTTDSVRTVFATVAVAEGENGHFREGRKQAVTRTLLERFRASDARQSEGTVNVLAALREVQTRLRAVGTGRYEVLIMSSGQMREPIDLVKHPQFLSDPAATAEQLAKANLLPDLQDFGVAFLSPGEASDERSLALTALWWQVVTEAGGQLTGFSRELVSWPQTALPEPRVPGVVRVPAAPGKIRVRVPDSVLFDVEEATIRADAAPVVAELAALLKKRYPEAPAQITGYTDSTGSAAYNLKLSRARATAVAAALAAAGVPRSRLSVAGRGASGFVADNDTAAGRQANRRVEITLAVG